MQPIKNSSIIVLQDVDKSYFIGEVTVPVLRNTSLTIQEGELVVVFGVSGCGKTTLLNLIGALDSPDAGSIGVDGEEISTLSQTELTEFRRRKLGFVFQFYNLLPTLTARENVESALELLDLTRKEVEMRALDYLERVGLGDKARKFPAQLSGGEQQRVAIARALAKEPRVLLADEPTGNLDEETSQQVAALLQEMNRSFGTTMVVVSHNPQIGSVAKTIVRIKNRQIIEEKKL